MKKLYVSFTLIFCLLVVGFSNTGRVSNNVDNLKSVTSVDYGLMDLANVYTTLEEITNASSLVAEVKLTDVVKEIKYEGATFSFTDARIIEVIKGDKKYNDKIISIIEIASFNINLTKKNDKFLLFLIKYDGPVTAEEAFVIAGVYQGKFSIDDKNKIKYDAVKYKGVETFQKVINEKDLNEIKRLIKNKSS